MSIELVTLIMFGGLITCLLLGIPLAWSLGGVSVLVSYILWGPGSFMMVVYNTFGSMWSIVLVAIPLFITMGLLMEKSGIAESLFEAIHRWSGSLRGGVAMGVVIICVLFAAMTGVSAAATLTMGVVALPAMLKRGYDKGIALGSIAGPGTLGILIPPSIISILLAMVGNLSDPAGAGDRNVARHHRIQRLRVRGEIPAPRSRSRGHQPDRRGVRAAGSARKHGVGAQAD